MALDFSVASVGRLKLQLVMLPSYSNCVFLYQGLHRKRLP